MDELRQLSIRNVVVSSWSKFLLKGTGLSYLLDSFFSDQSNRTLDESLIRKLLFGCLLAEPTSFSKKKTKKNEKNNALEMVPDQTQLRSKTFMIRSNCTRSRLWSDKSALESAYDQTQLRSNEIASDQTQVRSNPPMIRLFRPKWPLIRPSPDHDQTVVHSNFRKDPVISVWEHMGVRSTGSDQKSIWVWTSTWVLMVSQSMAKVLFLVLKWVFIVSRLKVQQIYLSLFQQIYLSFQVRFSDVKKLIYQTLLWFGQTKFSFLISLHLAVFVRTLYQYFLCALV